MPIQLPIVPLTADIKSQLVTNRADLKPVLGGPFQRVNRLGSRHRIEVSIPALGAACARTWLAARAKAEAENDTLLLSWPQPQAIDFGATPVIDGAGQLGTNLAVRGLPAGAAWPGGLFLSFDFNGRKYLHQTTSDVVASPAGKAVLTISPMLRVSPVDGQGLYLDPPLMEGLIDGTTLDWTLQLKRWTGISFALVEVE